MSVNIDNLLTKNVLSGLRNPVLDDARGLPAAIYTSEEFFAAEQKSLFPSTWMGIAFDSQVPKAGDAVPLTVLGLPMLLSRDRSGQVHVLHNVCRHRATIVVEKPCSGQQNFKCPYHGWTYDLDGSLIATPFWDGTPKSDRKPVKACDNGLVQVRSGVWNHIVFVNLDGKAPELKDYLGPMDKELEHYDFDCLEMEHTENWDFHANWKLVMENWEVYHHVWVHEGIFDRMSDEVDLETGEPYTAMTAETNTMMLTATGKRPQRGDPGLNNELPPLPTKWDPGRPTSTANAILPNVTATVGRTAFAPAIYTPIGPGHTHVNMAWFFAPGVVGNPDHIKGREAVLERWLGKNRTLNERTGIRSQDHRCMELQQLARSSPIADDVKFSTTWEENVRYFQDWVVRQMGR